jgi:murein DD-endopeptidase MepM/ murein hydrolase activator NlpD
MKRTLYLILKKAFSLIILPASLLLMNSCGLTGCKEEVKPVDTVVVEEPVMMYDIPIDSFIIEHGEILANQSLSDLLLPYGVTYQQIDEIVRKSDTVFDLRKIGAGKSFTLFFPLDTNKSLRYFVYEHSEIDFVVFDFTDSISVYKKKKEVKTEEKQACVLIETSLWNAMENDSLDPLLANELSEIFAWSVDFFGLQKGDCFKFFYNEQFVEGNSIGSGEVLSACFSREDSLIYAIPFVQDSIESFFDQSGNSLRRAFLKAPLNFNRISSHFSGSRMHPVLKVRRPHYGVDYAAPAGTPVQSIGDGKVIFMGYSGGAGKMVKIRHNSVYTTAYLHLSGYGNISNGQFVEQGDVIGYVGSTGLSTGPHLDFRFYKNDQPVDPLKVESPPVDPVKPENLAAFDSIRKIVIPRLDKIIP